MAVETGYDQFPLGDSQGNTMSPTILAGSNESYLQKTGQQRQFNLNQITQKQAELRKKKEEDEAYGVIGFKELDEISSKWDKDAIDYFEPQKQKLTEEYINTAKQHGKKNAYIIMKPKFDGLKQQVILSDGQKTQWDKNMTLLSSDKNGDYDKDLGYKNMNIYASPQQYGDELMPDGKTTVKESLAKYNGNKVQWRAAEGQYLMEPPMNFDGVKVFKDIENMYQNDKGVLPQVKTQIVNGQVMVQQSYQLPKNLADQAANQFLTRPDKTTTKKAYDYAINQFNSMNALGKDEVYFNTFGEHIPVDKNGNQVPINIEDKNTYDLLAHGVMSQMYMGIKDDKWTHLSIPKNVTNVNIGGKGAKGEQTIVDRTWADINKGGTIQQMADRSGGKVVDLGGGVLGMRLNVPFEKKYSPITTGNVFLRKGGSNEYKMFPNDKGVFYFEPTISDVVWKDSKGKIVMPNTKGAKRYIQIQGNVLTPNDGDVNLQLPKFGSSDPMNVEYDNKLLGEGKRLKGLGFKEGKIEYLLDSPEGRRAANRWYTGDIKIKNDQGNDTEDGGVAPLD